jgi:hypothetical protein
MIRKFKQQHLVTRQVVKSENVHILTDKIIALGSFFPPSIKKTPHVPNAERQIVSTLTWFI